ncbi:MAG: tRNA-splicing endonuclease subunit sen54 [Chaenotheca gracillima]|nr:MAG: tRNA-splicing endonuclease subunit sen54 [Chaenotheca gracillima]
MVNRKTRWMMLLYLNNVHYEKVIFQVFDTKSPHPDSLLYRQTRTTIMNSVKAYKHETIKNMLAHVGKLKSMQGAQGGLLRSSSDVGVLNEFFCETFNKENFLNVFHFMNGYLDVDNSSDLGKYYLRNIYANLAAQCKLLSDRMEKNEPGIRDLREEIGAFFDSMPTKSEFDGVSKAEFAEIFQRSARRRPQKKIRRLADDDARFKLSGGPPPAPTASAETTDAL